MLAILAAVMLAAAPGSDTVYTTNGGRIVGTVIEETPQGITVQLPDGTTRRLARNQVSRIEYSDGSVSTPSRSAPPAQPPAYPAQPPPPTYRPPPPPAYAPPYPPPSAPYQPVPPGGPHGVPQLTPFWFSFGLGGTFFSGDAAGATAAGPAVSMGNLFNSQFGLWFEGGGRLTPHLGLGLYLDLGIGDPSSEVSSACAASGTSCTATSGRVGPLLRYTFQPFAPSTPWVAIGTGYEWADMTLDYGGANAKYFGYTGWEMARLMAGFDFRTSPVFGFGLYTGVSFGRFSHYEEPPAGLGYAVGSQSTHTTFEVGLRFTLFP